jgi:hypothetical protein
MSLDVHLRLFKVTGKPALIFLIWDFHSEKEGREDIDDISQISCGINMKETMCNETIREQLGVANSGGCVQI